MAVQIDSVTSYEPDALVRCGERLPPDAVKVVDPLIVVEVGSPSSLGRDTGVKFTDYFRLPSLGIFDNRCEKTNRGLTSAINQG